MKVIIETHANKLVMIMPLTDDVYGTASRVAMTFDHSDLQRALDYRKVTEVSVDVFDYCPEIEAALGSLIVSRRNGITWKML